MHHSVLAAAIGVAACLGCGGDVFSSRPDGNGSGGDGSGGGDGDDAGAGGSQSTGGTTNSGGAGGVASTGGATGDGGRPIGTGGGASTEGGTGLVCSDGTGQRGELCFLYESHSVPLPEWVVAGNFNGDDLVDLASAGVDTHAVSVLTNGIEGTFVETSTLDALPGLSALVAADLDNSQTADLIALSEETNQLTVFRSINNGFQPTTAATTGIQPIAMDVGDFDRNNALDVVIASLADTQLTVLLSEAGGTTTSTAIVLPCGPSAVMTTLLDDNEALDIVVGCTSGALLAFINNGNGSFLPEPPVFLVGPILALASGDLDGVGGSEIVIGLAGNTVSIFSPNAGPGGLPRSFPVDGVVHDVAVGDLDGDSLNEVVVSVGVPDGVHVLFDPMTENSAFTPIPISGPSQPRGIALAHLNGDSLLDIAVADAVGAVGVYLSYP